MSHNSTNKESSYLKYWDVNNSYGWKMSQKLLVNKCEWIKDTSQFNEELIIKKNYNKESVARYFLEVDVQYFENDLPFLSQKIKTEKVKKLVTNLHDKTEYIIHIRNLKQALNSRSQILKKV